MSKPILNLEDLMLRCFVNPDTGCWEWRGYRTPHGTAKVNYRDPETGRRIAAAGRRASLHLKHRKEIGCGRAVPKACCHEPGCVNPDHSRLVSEAEYGKWLSKLGVLSKPAHNVARRKVGQANGKLSLEKAREIRRSGLSTGELARQYGVSPATIKAVRAGMKWKEVAANASVFSWRPAA